MIFGEVIAGAAYPTPAMSQPDLTIPRPPAKAPPVNGTVRRPAAPATPGRGSKSKIVASVPNLAGSKTASPAASNVNLKGDGATARGGENKSIVDGDDASRAVQDVAASKTNTESQQAVRPGSKKPTRASSLAGSRAGSKPGSRVASTSKLSQGGDTRASEASPDVAPGVQPSSALGVAAGVLGLDTEGKAATEGAGREVSGAGYVGPGDMGGERDGKTVGLEPVGMVDGGMAGVQGLDHVPVGGDAGPGIVDEASQVKA